MEKTLLFFLPFILMSSTLAGDLADSILTEADQYRNRWPSFTLKTKIVNYKDNKQDDESNFEVMLKGDSKSLVRFLNADQKGQYMLMLDDKMWLYMPNTRRPIRVTPLQKLTGDASNGDVARTNFSRDYKAQLLGEDSIQNNLCYKLELLALNEAATYQRVEYWVTKDKFRPIKAELYLASGKRYKSISYDQYEIIHGYLTLVKMTLYDRLRENRYTIMEFSEYMSREIPDKYFNVNYLTQLK